jgi:hypothetical protein
MLLKRITVLTITAALLAGCGLTPVKSELILLDGDRDTPIMNSEYTKVVFFNNSSTRLFGVDGTGRSNVWIDDKAVGGPDIGEFIQLQVTRGRHNLKLVHKDGELITSIHEVDVQSNPTYLELLARLRTNEVRVSDELPSSNLIQKPLVAYRQ